MNTPTPLTDSETKVSNGIGVEVVASVFARTLEKELAKARNELSKMHRRAQRAESIIAKAKLVEGRPQNADGRSIGRALANYAAAQAIRQRDEAIRIAQIIEDNSEPHPCSKAECDAFEKACEELDALKKEIES